MQKRIFVFIVICFLVGCAEQNSDKNIAKSKPRRDEGFPVKVGVQSEKGFPVQLNVQEQGALPVELQIPEDMALPVKLQMPQAGSLPVEIKAQEGHLLAVEIESRNNQPLPIRLQMDEDQPMPIEMKLPPQIVLILIGASCGVILLMTIIITFAVCCIARSAKITAKAVKEIHQYSNPNHPHSHDNS